MKKPDFISWGKEFSVGNESIDDDHKYLLHLINDIYRSGRLMKKEDVEFFLSSLIAYAVKHFHREESHMIQIGFDDIVRHKAAHEVFLVKVSEFHDRFRKTDGLTIIGEMSKFLGSWWTDHILREDRRYMTPAPPKNPRV